ncbi:uncharacterized protein EAF02_008432 [Botrytis sinoallii]|uniref:uncharacterized protein n=1 Tax=Botrytis sinoallii TaxID=1463999 RepID=UPI0018FFC725|nr:uncharacterized protein EAF02_008432 [Botrytis sinoallii]KAF7874455.1 hypothetical protein EAF02_008432 [Botrytis sinoallii]
MAARREILLKFDVEPSKLIRLAFRTVVFTTSTSQCFAAKGKSLVAKSRTHAVPFSQKPAQAPSPNLKYTNRHVLLRETKAVTEQLSTTQRNSNNLIILRIASISKSTVRSCGRMYQMKPDIGSTMCLLVHPGTEEGTFKRVGLAQISDLKYCSSLPWEMRTIVLV